MRMLKEKPKFKLPSQGFSHDMEVKQVARMFSFIPCILIYIREFRKCIFQVHYSTITFSTKPQLVCRIIHSLQIPSHFISFTGNTHIAQCKCTCNQIKSKPRPTESQPKFEWKLQLQCDKCRG
jgi:hypothetical protein